MKFVELKLDDAKNVKMAKRIRALARDKAKKQNPEESPERGGWSVDPHQGVPNNPRITR